jgi:hypothetical protein
MGLAGIFIRNGAGAMFASVETMIRADHALEWTRDGGFRLRSGAIGPGDIERYEHA